MINIFLDTNIYLSFYRFSSEDIEKLENLIILIKETKDVNLYITSQVVDEFYRNRDTIISESFKGFEDSGKTLNSPLFFKKYEEFKNVKDTYKAFKDEKGKFEQRLKSDIENFALPPDQIIKELFEIGEIIEVTDIILQRAKNRYDSGNPPGKKGSYGDAINWEALLFGVPEFLDLNFVCADGDFQSILDKKKLNSFLLTEWRRKKSSNIFYYDKISDFLREAFPQIGQMDEYIKDSQIEKLKFSPNFNRSRQLLDGLLKINNFSDAQINKIVELSLGNNQIYGAHQYSPELIGDTLNVITMGRHRAIRPDIYDKFCDTFGIHKEIYYYKDTNGDYLEIPF